MQAESFAELVRMKLRIRYRRKPQPGLEQQSETSVFVVRNGSRSLAQVAAQQKKNEHSLKQNLAPGDQFRR
jgi:hypothetical protein